MKKVVLSVVMLLVTGFAFAQEKAVKEAKKIAGAVNPDFAQAEQLISGALTNPETKDQAETWNVAGFIQKRRSEKEMENAYLRKPYDTLQVYKSALDMCKYYLTSWLKSQMRRAKLRTNTAKLTPPPLRVSAETSSTAVSSSSTKTRTKKLSNTSVCMSVSLASPCSLRTRK